MTLSLIIVFTANSGTLKRRKVYSVTDNCWRSWQSCSGGGRPGLQGALLSTPAGTHIRVWTWATPPAGFLSTAWGVQGPRGRWLSADPRTQAQVLTTGPFPTQAAQPTEQPCPPLSHWAQEPRGSHRRRGSLQARLSTLCGRRPAPAPSYWRKDGRALGTWERGEQEGEA